MTHETAAGHHQADSLAALISAKSSDNMNLDFIAGTHLKVWKKAYRDYTLKICIWCKKL